MATTKENTIVNKRDTSEKTDTYVKSLNYKTIKQPMRHIAHNLYIKVNKHSKVWYVDYTDTNGKQQRKSLNCEYKPEMKDSGLHTSIKDAIRKADEYIAKVNKGIKPELVNITVEKALELWIEHIKVINKGEISNKCFKDKEALIKKHINPIIGNIKLSALKKVDIENLIYTKTKVIGSRIYYTIRAMYSYAIKNEYIENKDIMPVYKEIIGNIEYTKRPAITDNEIEFGKVVRIIKNNHKNELLRNLNLFIIYSACRSIEAVRIKWNMINWNEMVINIPAQLMKEKKDYFIPITNQIKDVLDNMMKFRNNNKKDIFNINEYVFHKAISYNKPYIVGSLNSYNNRNGVDTNKQSIHGFRACFSTYSNGTLQIFSKIVEKQLSHSQGKDVKYIYDRNKLCAERLKALQMYDDWVDKVSDENYKGENKNDDIIVSYKQLQN